MPHMQLPHMQRRMVTALLVAVVGISLTLTAPAVTAAPTEETSAWKSAPKGITKKVVAAVNAEEKTLNGPSRPSRCFSIARFAGKKPWVKVQLREDQPVSVCQQADGFGTQIWERSAGKWSLVAYESGIGQETCKLMRDFKASELKLLKRGGLCLTLP